MPLLGVLAEAWPWHCADDSGRNGWRVAGGRLSNVKKTSIYIEPDVDVALSRRAALEGTTKAALIRSALRAAAQDSLRVRPRARGVFAGPADLAETVDERLAESGFGQS
jgi:hypothetical protein